MKKHFLFILLLAASFNGYSQNENDKINAIGISIPVIWNNSNGVFYSAGRRQKPSGKATSFGLSVNYTRSIYKNLYGIVGIGYFKQNFNIIRPFNFDGDVATNLLYSTKKYNYQCVTLSGGLGYSFKINRKFKINTSANYTLPYSFKQTYEPTRYSGAEFKKIQINKLKMQVGDFVNLSLGLEYKISQKISLMPNLIIPIITKWKNDKVFIGSGFGNDAQIIAENKSSIGASIIGIYNF